MNLSKTRISFIYKHSGKYATRYVRKYVSCLLCLFMWFDYYYTEYILPNSSRWVRPPVH